MIEEQIEPRTLLVIDDEPDILDAIRRLFRKRYRVLVAQTTSEAREMLANEHVEVVLCDQRLPRSSGIEFLTDIRETHPNIVRVLFTGYTNLDDIVDAINQGHVYRYISKPWQPAELRLLIDQAFEHYAHMKEREKLLSDLKAANLELAAKNDQLTLANEQLETVNRVRQVFMEVISHELNTPIAIIIGYVFLLKRELGEDLSSVSTKALDRVEASSRRLKQISERIFQMMSLDDPSNALHPELVSIRDFAIELHNQVDPFLQRREQKLASSIDLAGDELYADPSKLLDIFTHLTMNAIKFSRNGETIYFMARPSPENPDEVALSIRDNGIGISEEDRGQIFDLFFSSFRTEHHSSGDFEFGKRGMGLGLSIAKHFTEMHGGRIECVSEEGRGSTFTVYLPRNPKT
ncbi:MAG: hybrid sensor histidine kinase/response regulator [Myxococcota bacterium]|jgi:signal transduction histidine kinase|nr:hybrid sensor histidine kinase/response regulator [Myxococcota bacterium]MEC9440014.1 hybrid sensor histidine kinase/response regulator [Myxococcota bacterium]